MTHLAAVQAGQRDETLMSLDGCQPGTTQLHGLLVERPWSVGWGTQLNARWGGSTAHGGLLPLAIVNFNSEVD